MSESVFTPTLIASDGPFTLHVVAPPFMDGANHHFRVRARWTDEEEEKEKDVLVIDFQEGGLQEVAPNGAPDVLLVTAVYNRVCHYHDTFGGKANAKQRAGLALYLEGVADRNAAREAAKVEGLQTGEEVS